MNRKAEKVNAPKHDRELKWLRGTENWREWAIEGGWCVATLAKNSGVSVSALERFFKLKFGKCPHEWMEGERLRSAPEKLAGGLSVKETATATGYKNQHHFSAAFKRVHGYPPKERRI